MSRWISIETGFLQGDNHSPVGSRFSEVLIGMLLSKTRGYKMGNAREKDREKDTHLIYR